MSTSVLSNKFTLSRRLGQYTLHCLFEHGAETCETRQCVMGSHALHATSFTDCWRLVLSNSCDLHVTCWATRTTNALADAPGVAVRSFRSVLAAFNSLPFAAMLALENSPLHMLAAYANAECSGRVVVASAVACETKLERFLMVIDTCRALVDMIATDIPADGMPCLAFVLRLDNWATCPVFSERYVHEAGFETWAAASHHLYGQLTPLGHLAWALAQRTISPAPSSEVAAIAYTTCTLPVLDDMKVLSTAQPPSIAQQWAAPPRSLIVQLVPYVCATAVRTQRWLQPFLLEWRDKLDAGALVDVRALLDAAFAADSATDAASRPFRWFTLAVTPRLHFDDDRRVRVTLTIRASNFNVDWLKSSAVALTRANLVPVLKVGDPLAIAMCAFGVYASVTALQRILACMARETRAAGIMVARMELESIARLPEIGMDAELYANLHDAVARLDARFYASDTRSDACRSVFETPMGADAVRPVPMTSRAHSARPLMVRELTAAIEYENVCVRTTRNGGDYISMQ